MLYQSTCVGLGYDLMEGYFLEPMSSPFNPIRTNYLHDPSQSSWPGNINPVPIDYAFRPRLRGRLTLLRLALSRNPWTFGESVSHTLYRYSRQHSHFPALHPISRSSFTAQGTLRYRSPKGGTQSFGSWLEPRYIFAARQLD